MNEDKILVKCRHYIKPIEKFGSRQCVSGYRCGSIYVKNRVEYFVCEYGYVEMSWIDYIKMGSSFGDIINNQT